VSDAQETLEKARDKGPRWRRIVTVVLVVVGTLSLLGANLMIYVRRTVLETNSFVDTLAPLSSDTDVTTALAERLTVTISEAIGARELVQDGLPDNLAFLAGPITTSVEDFVAEQVQSVLSSDEFARIWRRALIIVHEQATAVLNDDKEFLKTSDGKVVLDLTSVVDTVAQKLNDAGLELPDSAKGTIEDKLGPDVGMITLYSSDQLRELQDAVDLLNKVAQVLYVLTIVAFAGAVAAAVRRRRTIMAIGAASLGVMVVTLIALSVARGFIVDSVDADLQRRAAGEVFNTIARGLLNQTYVLIIVALALFVGGLVMGPYRWATWLRRVVDGWIDAIPLGRSPSSGAVGTVRTSLSSHRSVWMGSGVVASLVFLILWPRPTPLVLGLVALPLVVYLVVVSVFAQDEAVPSEDVGSAG